MVAVALERPDLGTAALVLAIETKAIVLLDRMGTPTPIDAPAIRVGFIASATIVDARGDVQGRMSAPITPDRALACQHLVNLGTNQGILRGRLATVGVFGDATTRTILRDALAQLREAGDCEDWIEVLDPALLRSRLARLLSILEPVDHVRDEVFGAWDLALAFEVGAIERVIAELRQRVERLEPPVLEAARAFLAYLEAHRASADYGALLARGIEIPVPSRMHHELLPIRLARGRLKHTTDAPL